MPRKLTLSATFDDDEIAAIETLAALNSMATPEDYLVFVLGNAAKSWISPQAKAMVEQMQRERAHAEQLAAKDAEIEALRTENQAIIEERAAEATAKVIN